MHKIYLKTDSQAPPPFFNVEKNQEKHQQNRNL